MKRVARLLFLDREISLRELGHGLFELSNVSSNRRRSFLPVANDV